MKCSSNHVSFAAWRLHVFRRLLETSHSYNPRITKRPIVSTAKLRNQASPDSENTAKDDKNRIPPSQRLPQSPLINHPQTEPRKTRKRRPGQEDLRPLAKNPWAVALASPMRTCSLTAARLPRALLGDWGLVRESDTNKINLLPVGLLKENLGERELSLQSDQPMEKNWSTSNESDTQQESAKLSRRDQRQDRQQVVRMVDDLPLLQRLDPLLSRGSNSKRPAVGRLLPHRWKYPHGPITAREEKDLAWKAGMPEYMLGLMRTNVVEKLARICKKFPRVEAPSIWNALDMHEYSDSGLEDALRRLPPVDGAECGAVVLLGSFPESTIRSDTVVLPPSQRAVPIFDMSAFLSESDLHKLLEAVPSHFHNTALLFRPDDSMGVETMLSIWRLKRFLAGAARSNT